MNVLRVTSLQAQNADSLVRSIVEYLDDRPGLEIELVGNLPWQKRAELLDAGRIHVAWLCGLYYVRRVDRVDARIELLAAPVMLGERYQHRPIYFSDVVVRSDSAYRTFAELRGASWAYNEPGSHSGYNVVRYHLHELGEPSSYFGQVVESGAHQASLRMVLDGRVDASAIDSTVLETELERQPELRSRLRIIETLGPSPAPPWVVARSLSRARREILRELLLGMHDDPEGLAILGAGRMAGFARVEDEDYDPIRRMARKAEPVTL
jgi:phosphonate transport system substrate-binding protein